MAKLILDILPSVIKYFESFTWFFSIVANLKQVPNQHIRYKDDPKKEKRDENQILAYGWRHFFDDPTKPEYLAELPMTKAAIKAMDTVTDFVNKTFEREISNYCVGGASKVNLQHKFCVENNDKFRTFEIIVLIVKFCSTIQSSTAKF